eukprot:scaffold21367_cov117-Isochrysis_galbana.AAC.1
MSALRGGRALSAAGCPPTASSAGCLWPPPCCWGFASACGRPACGAVAYCCAYCYRLTLCPVWSAPRA